MKKGEHLRVAHATGITPVEKNARNTGVKNCAGTESICPCDLNLRGHSLPNPLMGDVLLSKSTLSQDILSEFRSPV